jgi:photosystem II stability/assembly factor-like uncharacterized protein
MFRRTHNTWAMFGLALVTLAAGCQESASPVAAPWDEVVLSSDAEFRDIFFLDEGHGWIVGGGYNIDGGILGETSDGGAHWRFRVGIVPQVRTRLFHLNAVVFQDATNGIIAADEGRILRTVDSGAHWHTLVRAGRQLADLFFLDTRMGWAAGEQWVLRTEDGGASWARANATSNGNGNFRATAIHFIDARRGWLVGHHGAVRRTEDAGTTWIGVDVPLTDSTPVLSAVQFVNERRGWIVGAAGTILNSRDGGLTWASQPSGSLANFRDVHFIDENHGWIVGFDPTTGRSTVLHTTNGGTSWIQQATIHGESLEALTFQTSGQGWAVGDRVRRKPQRLLRYTPPAPAPPSPAT